VGEEGSVDTLFFADTHHTPLEFFLFQGKKKYSTKRENPPNFPRLLYPDTCSIQTRRGGDEARSRKLQVEMVR